MRRRSQVEKLIESSEHCSGYSEETAAKADLPGPKALGLSEEQAKDFIIWPVVYTQKYAGLGRWYGSLGASVQSTKS